MATEDNSKPALEEKKEVLQDKGSPYIFWKEETMTLQELQEKMSIVAFGIAKSEALQEGVCISCGKPALPRCYSEAGRREFKISGLCEICFGEITRLAEDYNPNDYDDSEPTF